MNGKVYWIWLSQVLGFGSRNIEQITDRFGSAKAVFDAPPEIRRESGLFSKDQLLRAQDSVTMDNTLKIARRCDELRINAITPEDEVYPRRFLDICDYPAVIYYKGKMPQIDDNVVITMVGTRFASKNGKQIASALSQSLAESGVIIVSGGAKGIDNAAHIGTFSTQTPTVSILGCGLDVNYNMDCAPTRQRILEQGGVLMTEYPPGYNAAKYTFPIRNRLLSAISLGVIVGEGGIKSGSLITASRALEQGKDIFAIPGDVMSELSQGPNQLIRDGAKPVTCAYDVLEEYIGLYPHRLNVTGSQMSVAEIARGAHEYIDSAAADSYTYVRTNLSVLEKKHPSPKRQKTLRKCSLPEEASENARAVYGQLLKGAVNLDELQAILGLTASEVLVAVTELEMEGIIRTDRQRNYQINEQ